MYTSCEFFYDSFSMAAYHYYSSLINFMTAAQLNVQNGQPAAVSLATLHHAFLLFSLVGGVCAGRPVMGQPRAAGRNLARETSWRGRRTLGQQLLAGHQAVGQQLLGGHQAVGQQLLGGPKAVGQQLPSRRRQPRLRYLEWLTSRRRCITATTGGRT